MDIKKATTLASVTVMTFMLAGGFFVQVSFTIQICYPLFKVYDIFSYIVQLFAVFLNLLPYFLILVCVPTTYHTINCFHI